MGVGRRAVLRRPEARSDVTSATPSLLVTVASTPSPSGERRTWSIHGAVPAVAAAATAASMAGASIAPSMLDQQPLFRNER